MSTGHEALMAGHLRKSKTAGRIMSSFFWPGAMADVKRFCASCDMCQRTTPKGMVKKVPLQNPPLIDTPFRRVAIDLIGPISPASGSGKKYILTTVDYATRYPEAVALKGIETERVPETLVEIFFQSRSTSRGPQRSRYSVHLCSDEGSQQLHTTPYHQQGNGLVERFNGTLKNMLRKMCEEKPSDWDRYLPAVLFAYREAPQDIVGFSLFELLYGRTVRGPVSILKELWTKEQEADEVKTTHQYG